MGTTVVIIVVIVIILQVGSCVWNIRRMMQYSNVFCNTSSWGITAYETSRFVTGIIGSGNSVFSNIRDSINKYLRPSAGSVIDFGLIKDTVDRNCDAVEDEINTQLPIPLYLGLLGTMVGVILGLFDLLRAETITDMTAGGAESTASMTEGISSLLSGVAMAMIASGVGIVLTTISTVVFAKKLRPKAENGRNAFLTWMQEKLIPRLPGNTSEALASLVDNLNEFNCTFASNTESLGTALGQINESYAKQAEIIDMISEIDIEAMARGNVMVLNELRQSVFMLEQFNTYLHEVQGYTEQIHRFEELFGEREQRLEILEDIHRFFNRHRDAITKTVADSDDALRNAIDTLRESATDNVGELRTRLTQQANVFTDLLTEQRSAFERFFTELTATFNDRLESLPDVVNRLDSLADIPGKLDAMVEKISDSNERLASRVSNAVENVSAMPVIMAQPGDKFADESNDEGVRGSFRLAAWEKYTALVCLIVIAAACVWNIFN